jgi:hypothetical protein
MASGTSTLKWDAMRYLFGCELVFDRRWRCLAYATKHVLVLVPVLPNPTLPSPTKVDSQH